MDAPQSWLQRALGWAITFVVVALLVRWGWELLRPLLPVLVIISVAIVMVRMAISRYRRF
jgi:hypothetical protein